MWLTSVARGQNGIEVKSMIDLVLMKKDMLRYVQGVKVLRGIGLELSNHHVILCKVRLVETSIKRREVVAGARRIRSEKLREHQYREGYARSIDGKGVEWDGDNNVENMWEQRKRVMFESAREVYGSVRVKGPQKRVMER